MSGILFSVWVFVLWFQILFYFWILSCGHFVFTCGHFVLTCGHFVLYFHIYCCAHFSALDNCLVFWGLCVILPDLVLCYCILFCAQTFCVGSNFVLFYGSLGLWFFISFCFVLLSKCLSLCHCNLSMFCFSPSPNDRSLCLSSAEEFSSGRSLPFINPSSLETLRALVHEIQSSETDPEIWKNCEVLRDRSALLFCLFGDLEAVSYSGFWGIM